MLGQTAVSVGDNGSSEQQDPRLTSDFDIGVVRCFVVVLDNPTHAICVQGIFELPECVAAEVEADEECLSPWQS